MKIEFIIRKYLLLLFISILCSFPVLSESGCCLNKHAEVDYCATWSVDKADCCSNRPDYYRTPTFDYPPDDYAQCSKSYFIGGVHYCIADDYPECKSGCCCIPNQNPVIIPKGLCDVKANSQFFGDISDGSNCQQQCNLTIPQTQPGDCPASSGPNIQFTVLPVKGEKAFHLSWSDPCDAVGYEINRYKGGNKEDTFKTKQTYYKDDSSGLLWEQDYMYEIKGQYVSNADSFASRAANLGNLECWHQKNHDKFCINTAYYIHNYKDYLLQFPKFNQGYFPDKIASEFSEHINKAYHCRQDNTLSSQYISCPQDKVCVIEKGTEVCKQQSACEPDFSNSPFGLYTAEQACYGLGYCYYDTSRTLVDKCYACSYFMSCYDYKSESACISDSCQLGNCQWKPIFPELGAGVCIDNSTNNCDWCSKPGSDNLPDSSGHNTFYSVCSPEKAAALSTNSNLCYYFEGKAKSCSKISCLDLKQCAADIKLNADNSLINAGDDPCSIGVCRMFGQECRKDADADDAKDCNDNDLACELDHYPPETELVPVMHGAGFVKGFAINLKDKTPHGKATNPAGARVYLCINELNGQPCSNVPGKNYQLYTEDTAISINGLQFSDANNRRTITNLKEGENEIYFYGKDKYKNLGIVKHIKVNASSQNIWPELVAVQVENAFLNQADDTYYTNNKNPTIRLIFQKNRGAMLLEGSTLLIAKDTTEYKFDIMPAPSFGEEDYVLTLKQNNIDLPEGEYTLYIGAKNQKGLYLEQSDSEYKIKIDYSISQAIITPPTATCQATPFAHDCVLTNSDITLNIKFPGIKKVNLTHVWLTSSKGTIDIRNMFLSGYDTDFSADLSLNDSVYTVTVEGKDLYGNDATGLSQFEINTKKPQQSSVWIEHPSYGVAPSPDFNLTVRSDNSMFCRYTVTKILPDDPADIFDRIFDFENTGGNFHYSSALGSGPLKDKSSYILLILCQDPYWDDTIYSFPRDLRYDDSPPNLEIQIENPLPISELPEELKISVLSQENIRCRYSETETEYDRMEKKFPGGFDEKSAPPYIKEIRINLTEKDDQTKKTYYIACENEAELRSKTHTREVKIDTNLPLDVIDRTERYQGTSDPTIKVYTTKDAICSYDSVKGVGLQDTQRLTSGTENSNIHSKEISLIDFSPGKNSIFVTCVTWKGEEKEIKVDFFIDLTEPEMQYVHDNSTIYGKPEFTAFQKKIHVAWYATDNQTGFIDGKGKLRYNFTLIEGESPYGTIINWTNNFETKYLDDNKFEGWIEKDHEGNELNLSDNTLYKFRVRAGNVVDKWSLALESDGVETDFSLQADLSCGEDGSCRIGESCSKNSNCLSGYCNEDGVCDYASCDDDVKNGNETDVDCGGGECDPCPDIGDSCGDDSDCASGACRNGICADRDACFNGRADLDTETDVDCGGICEEKCGPGLHCDSDWDCESGLSCIGSICKSAAQDEEQDSDGDGIPDIWEEQNGLDPDDSEDADEDFDGDGLNNYEEYVYGTNVNNTDTDGDGYSDKEEIEKNTDPLDPEDKPTSFWMIFLLIFLILIVLGAIGYLVYMQYFQPKKKQQKKPLMQTLPKPMQRFIPRRRPPAKPMPNVVKKYKSDKKKQRTSIFDRFGKEGEKKPSKNQAEKKEETKKDEQKAKGPGIQDKPKSRDDVFRKLSGIIEKDSMEKKTDTTDLKDLTKLSAATTTKIKQDLKKHSADIDSKLLNMEKKVKKISKPAVYATKAGSKYHKSSCVKLKSLPKTKLTRFSDSAAAKSNGLKPCNICNPEK
ncbi:hypothetical protein GF323_01210 [Candidatus Woesearchaeota archaeon]|nr:hypothetical protein [Candidatus Woesearchaeota archaeon]